jgi:hypothetical protein
MPTTDENQIEQQRMIDTAKRLPGVAEALDLYERLSVYVSATTLNPIQVESATGGNVG